MLRLVSFPRNSHEHICYQSNSMTKERQEPSPWPTNRPLLGLVTQRRKECNRGMTLQEAWHQCSFFLPTVIQTRVAIDYKVRVSEFILDKLEGFFALHWSIFSLESFESKGSFLLQKYKHQLLRSLFQPTHGKKIFCMRTMPTFTSVKGGQNKSLSHEISLISESHRELCNKLRSLKARLRFVKNTYRWRIGFRVII